MNQTLDVVSGPMQCLDDGRLEHGQHSARWLTDDRCNGWDEVDRVERQDRCIFVIDGAVMAGRTQGRVRAEMPVNQQGLVPVLLLFVDVLRRGDGKPPNRGHEDESDKPASEHWRHRMRGRPNITTEESLNCL